MTPSSNPLILVIGAGGQVGRHVVTQLRQCPDQVNVRISARSGERVASLQAEGYDAVLLDLDRPSTFADALRGVDRVFLLTGYTVAMLVQSKTFLDAARKACVEHIVHLGTFGSWDCTDPHIAWHQLVETYIKASGISWTHLHANVFMEHLINLTKITDDSFPIFWGKGRVGWVASKDIGAAAATILREGPQKHAAKDYWLSVEVAGGEELAALFTEASGRPIRCDYKQPDEFEEVMPRGAETEDWYAAGAMEFLRQFHSGHMGDFGMVRDDTPYLSDEPALTLKEWLRQNPEILE